MTSTRREFVAMLLGGGIASTLGCGGKSEPRRFDGELVETGQKRGHAMVRDAVKQAEVTTWRTHRVAIVGGGTAGLAAAWELRRRGIDDVVVFELDDVVGGTARGGSSAITGYPWGAHYIVSPAKEQTDLIALLQELDAVESMAADGTPTIDEALRCREPEERVFFKGRWYEGLYMHTGETPDDVRQLKQFLGEIDRWNKFRDADGKPGFAMGVSRCSSAPELVALDKQTFAGWLDERKLTSERLRWLCEYSCKDDYGLVTAETSAWAGIFYWASRVRGHVLDAQPVLTWPDGNYTLVRHLATRTKVESGVAVTKVNPDGSLVAHGPSGVFGVRASRVIVAAPSFVANRLVGRTLPVADYGAWAVANLHLHDRPPTRRIEPQAWDSVIYDSPSLGYVCATHQRGRDRGPTVFTWYYPFTGDAQTVRKQIAGAGHAEWAEVVLADIERAHPTIRTLVDKIDIAFWGHGMVRPRPGAMFSPDRFARAKPIEKVHFAHTDLSSIALFEEAFDHGLRAAREVAEALA